MSQTKEEITAVGGVNPDPAKLDVNPAAEGLFAVIKSKNSDGEQWKEIADLMTFSAGGASFHIEKDCKVGCLVSIMFAMPEHMRCYDFENELYRVFGLVQFCQPYEADGRKGFQVGVAFTGKNPPKSYGENPTQSYRIHGMNEMGLWNIVEAPTSFKSRRHIRYWTPFELYLALLDGKRDTIGGEWAKTDNISKSGAAVFTSLNLNVGDRVKFISEPHDFSGLAVVCNRSKVDNGPSTIHLQFVENEFPVQLLRTKRSRKK